MYQRPSSFRRNRPTRVGSPNRSSARHLSFELLENRTVLATDLAIVELRLDTASAFHSASMEIPDPIPSAAATANGLRMELVNATSPNSAEPSVDDRLLLRLSSSDVAVQSLIDVESQISITFDSDSVAVESSDGNLSAPLQYSSARNYVVRSLHGDVQSTSAMLLEVPFRVIGDGDTSFLARVVTSSVGGGFAFNGFHGFLDLSTPLHQVPESLRPSDGIAREHGHNGTIQLARPSIPPASPLLERPDPPFATMRDPFEDQPRREFKNAAEADSAGLSSASPARLSWSLSNDAMWNRHRTIVVLDGLSGSRRAAERNPNPFSSRLFNNDSTPSRTTRPVPSGLDVLHRSTSIRSSSRTLGIHPMFSRTGDSHLGDDDSDPKRVVILRPDECDSVLSQWKESSSLSTPTPK